MKYIISLLALLAVNAHSEEQTPFFKDSYLLKPPAMEFYATRFNDSGIRRANGTRFTQADAGIKTPLGTSGDINTGLTIYSFEYKQREFKIDSTIQNTTTQLYNINFPITYVKKGEIRNVILRVSPGLSSTLDKIKSEDFSGNALLQISKNKSNGSIKYNYGLVYTHAFGKGQLLPLMAASFLQKPNWLFTLGFPASIALYAPNDKSNYFAKVTPNGGSWHAYRDSDTGKRDAIEYKFRQVGYRASGGGKWNIAGPLWLAAETGIQFGQELHFVASDGTKESLSAKKTGFAELSLNMHF